MRQTYDARENHGSSSTRSPRASTCFDLSTQYELASTFLRVQEHYESPRFHGRIFTLEEYMDWYAAENGKLYATTRTGSGFNVPSNGVCSRFSMASSIRSSEKEKRLLGLFQRTCSGRFYVIGIFDEGHKGSLTHELAHALFFVDQGYRDAVPRGDARL